MKHKAIVFLLLILVASVVHATAPNREIADYKAEDISGLAYVISIIDDILDYPIVPYGKSGWGLFSRDSGKAESQKPGEEGWSPIWKARLLKSGDKVRTGPDSQVTIVFCDGSKATVGENTEIVITSDMLMRKESIRQLSGEIWVEVKKFMGKETTFEVPTPNGVIGARGTRFQVSVLEDHDEVVVYEGSVYMKSNFDGTEKTVSTGQKGLLYSDRSAEVTEYEDNIPLEIVMKDLCTNQIISRVQYTDPMTKALFGDDLPEGTDTHYLECTLTITRPKFVFYANKFIDPSTVNENTLIISDEQGDVPGYLDVSSKITFIPDRPIHGKIKATLKKDICSSTNVCLDHEISYDIKGAEHEDGINFRLTPTDPIRIIRHLRINNPGSEHIEAVISIPSLTNYPPNSYYYFEGIAPDAEYSVEGNVNKFVKISLSLEPDEIREYDLTYRGLSFGREYYQYIDVSEMHENQDTTSRFISPEEGIESDNSRIIDISNKIVGDETNPFWKSYRIYNWITTTIKYNFDEIYSGGALATIEKEEGVCQDFAQLFIALARAQKIPARQVDLYLPDDFEEGHAIAEIYIEGIGWIPVDPTWGTNFDNFAREDPLLVQTFKQEHASDKDILYQLEGTNELGVSITTSASFLDTADDNWASGFEDPNLKELYDLVLISNINLRIDSFINYYNQLSGKGLFKESYRQAKRNPFRITSDYVEFKKNNGMRESTIEQLGIAIAAYSEMVDFYLDSLTGAGGSSITLTFENTTITQDNILSSIHETKEKLGTAKSLFASEDYNGAATRFLGAYSQSHEEVETNIVSLLGLNSIDKTKLLDKAIVFTVAVFGIFFACCIFWAWMLINSIFRKEFRHLSKAGWILIIFFLSITGALIYFFIEYIRKPGRKISR